MEKRKRIISIIGLILIVGSTLFSFYILYNKFNDIQQTEQLIENNFKKEDSINKKKHKNIKNNASDIVLSDQCLGYIEIKNLGIKRIIVNGTNKKILDKGYVGILVTSASLDDEVGNTILAGHSISNVFQNLHYIDIGENVKIVTHQNTYNYVVTEKHVISDQDMSYFKQVDNEKIITLLTCKLDNSKRLVVIAKLKGGKK